MQIYKGIIQKGLDRGKELGFPTLNIPLHDSNVSGIYAARVTIDSIEYEAAAFADQSRRILEAHILDFPARDLYGKEVSIELLKKIRGGRAFDSDDDLRAAITDDIQKMRAYFASV